MKTLFKILLVFAVAWGSLFTVEAQSTKSEKNAAKKAELRKMINDRRYVFEATYVNPQRGGGRALTSEYDLKVSKDTIAAYLPYFGRAYTAPIDPTDGPIDFHLTNFNYTAKENKKGGWDIFIEPRDKNISNFKDIQSLRLSVSNDGYAMLQVLSSNRDAISFNGTIEKR